MRVETFLENFELLAEIPGAVPKLRELILELAVRGRLVEQDPNEESGSQLLARIRSLVDANAVKRKSNRKGLLNSFPPRYAIPRGWTWTTLNCIGILNPRNQAEDVVTASFVPMNLVPTSLGEQVRYEVRPWGEIKAGFTHFAEGDVVIAKITPCFQNRKSAVGRGLVNGLAAGTTELHVFRPIENTVVPEFVLLFLKSPGFVANGIERMTGSAGQKRVPTEYIAHTPFPLPPLAEQRRIVAKVDQLMALCDELERRQQARREGRERLCAAALDALTSAADADEVSLQWERIRENFGVLFAGSSQVALLRQAVVELGVNGLLTFDRKVGSETEGQIPSSSALRLEVPREIPVNQRGPDEPISIPANWSWVDFGQLVSSMSNGLYKPSGAYVEDGVACLRMYNIRAGQINFDNVKRVRLALDEIEQYGLQEGDLLINRVNSRELVGKAGVIPKLAEPVVFESKNIRVRLNRTLCSPDFANLFLRTNRVRRAFEADAKQTCGQASISQPRISGLRFPLPPLAEQQRIAFRVQELLAQCDALAIRLVRAEEDGKQLLDAVVRAISGAATNIAGESADVRQPDDGGIDDLRYDSTRVNGSAGKPLRTIPSRRAPTRNGAEVHADDVHVRRAAEPASPYRSDSDQRTLFAETETATKTGSERPRSIEEVDVVEVMAAFRRASRGAGRVSEDDLLRETALELGYRRLGSTIRERLKGHLRAAIRRRIIARDGDLMHCATPTIASCDDDLLLRTMGSVMKKSREYEVGEIVDMVAEHLGFARATAAMQERIGDVIRAGRKAGLLGTKGKWVWRGG